MNRPLPKDTRLTAAQLPTPARIFLSRHGLEAQLPGQYIVDALALGHEFPIPQGESNA